MNIGDIGVDGSPIVYFDDYGDPVTQLQDVTQTTAYNTGGALTEPQAETVAKGLIATNYGGTVSNDGNSITLPFLSPDQSQKLINQLATAGGQWAARQFGGNTVLYKNNQGGIGTMNIKSLLIPAAIVAALIFAGK